MAQHDYNIANQGFSSFRSDLNNALSAVQTCNSGTTRPTGAVAGQIWLDTTSATSPTLKYYDGADDISLATLDHTGNTVNWLDSNVSVTGLTTTATGTVITLSDTANTSTVNLIIDNQKEVRFRETTANGTNYIGLKAPASISADLTYTLPATDGTAGQFLSTNGSGVLSFATAGLTGATSTATGTVFTLSDTAITTTQNLIIDNDKEVRFREATANGTNYVSLSAPATLASDLTLTLPSADGTSGQVLQTNGSGVLSFAGVSASAGQVIQVLGATDTTVRTTTSTSFVTASNTLSVTITPSSASNKILIFVSHYAYNTVNNSFYTVYRGATPLGGSNGLAQMGAGGVADLNIMYCFLDSPSTTSATTYQPYMKSAAGGGTAFMNTGNIISQIIVMEIKG
jgi:hypothetical protein